MSKLCTWNDVDRPIQIRTTNKYEESSATGSIFDDVEYKAFKKILDKAVELEEAGNRDAANEMIREYERNKPNV